MYTFELNITDFTTPVYGGDWIEIPNKNLVYKGVKIDVAKEKDEYFKRVKISGSLKINGVVFSALETLSDTYSKVQIRIKKDTVVQATAYLSIRKELDYDSFISLNDCEPIDKYTELLTGYDKPQDILQIQNQISCKVVKEVEYETQSFNNPIFLYYSSSSCSKSVYTSLQNLVSPSLLEDIKAGSLTTPWRNVKTTILQTACSFDSGNYLRSASVTTVYQRQIFWVVQIGGIYTSPGPEWTDVSAESGGTKTIAGRNYKKYAKEPYSDETEYQISYDTSTQSTYFVLDIDSVSPDVVYTRFRDIRDVIETTVTNLDSTIIVDSSSFPYFDEFTAFNTMLITTLSDILLTASGAEKSNPATRSEFILKDFLEWLKVYQIYWYIDSNNRFILDHWKNIEAISTTIDSTSYLGKNWSVGKNKVTFDDGKLYSKHIFSFKAGNLDFLPQTVEFSRLLNIAQTITTESFGFHTDVLDIQNNPGQYNDSISEFVIMVAQEKTIPDFLNTTATTGEGGSGDNPLSPFSWSNETKSFVGGGTGSGACHWNSFTGLRGHRIHYKILYSDNDTSTTDLRLKRIVGGVHSIVTAVTLTKDVLTEGYFTISSSGATGTYYFEIYKGGGSGSAFIISGLSVEFYDMEELIVIEGTGEVTQTEIANADLSLANLLHYQYVYKLPDNVISFNENTNVFYTEDRKMKARKQEIFMPLRVVSDVEKDGVITNVGTGELESASIDLDGEHTQIKINQ